MKKSTVMMLIAVILSVIAISSGIVFFSQMADENKAEQTYENLSSLVSSEVEHENDEVIDLEGNVEHEYNGPTSYEKYLPIRFTIVTTIKPTTIQTKTFIIPFLIPITIASVQIIINAITKRKNKSLSKY